MNERLREIKAIISDCEEIQQSHESVYTKTQAMITAYCEIRDRVKDMESEG